MDALRRYLAIALKPLENQDRCSLRCMIQAQVLLAKFFLRCPMLGVFDITKDSDNILVNRGDDCMEYKLVLPISIIVVLVRRLRAHVCAINNTD